jgi:hypothetical protein
MPWSEAGVMDNRTAFIAACERGEEPISHLCARYGISRKCGYKWLERYHDAGLLGLMERSRAQHAAKQRFVSRESRMPWPRAAEDRVRQLAMRRNLRMRGTRRRAQDANYGCFRLVNSNGEAITPLWPLDQLEVFLLNLCGRSNGRLIGQIEIPPHQQGEFGVTP